MMIVNEEKIINGYYQSNIKTSRNEDSVYAMKYANQQMLIDKLQQENARLKDKIEKIIEYVNHYETIRGYYEYEECGYDEYNYEEDLKEELLEKLKEN